jgi:hypothetical protein
VKRFIYAVATAAAGGALCLAVAGTASATPAKTGPVKNATSACGSQCFDLSNLQLGLHFIQNKSNTASAKISLRQASNSFTNEDFIDDAVGTVSDYCSASPGAQQFNSTGYICTHYGSDNVYEANFAPDSTETGRCAGVAVANGANQNVTLQPCGATKRTMWIADAGDGTVHHGHFYTPWIQGSDTNFSHPLVLTLNTGTKNPADGLQVDRENFSGSSLPDNQEFTVTSGPAV